MRRDLVIVLLALAGLSPRAGAQAGGVALEVERMWDLRRAWSISAGPALELRPLYPGRASEDQPPALRNADLNVALRRRWLEHWRFATALRLRRRYAFSDAAAREVRLWWVAERVADLRYVRWSHRLRTEQRWRGAEGEALELSFRHRYRVAFETALSGLVVDEGEWYVSGNTELLLSAENPLSAPTSVDVRPYLGLGRGDVQVGLEYRRERALDAERDAGNRTAHAVLAVLRWSP